MRAGKLDTPVTFQSVTVGVDGMGSPTETWANMTGTPTKAEYIAMRGGERIEAMKLSEKEQFKLRIRRTATITRDCRVVINSTNYDIIDIEDGKRGQYMVLFCREAAA